MAVTIQIGTVREVEKPTTPDGADGLRIRAEIASDGAKNLADIPWAFPLMPKVFQSVPKEGEGVLIFLQNTSTKTSQRFYIGPIISQPQYHKLCKRADGTSLFKGAERDPLEKMSNEPDTDGSFPNYNDIAVVGRGSEDIILKYNDVTKESEIDLRAGIRGELIGNTKPNLVGNVIFHGVDPAYIQLKYKAAIASDYGQAANSLINLVANRINIMSNLDNSISHNLRDKDTLVKEDAIDDIMSKLHKVPKGDLLIKFLELLRTVLLTHVHSWPGNVQCGDTANKTGELSEFPINDILSEYVRIS